MNENDWNFGERYKGRVCGDEIAIKVMRNAKKTSYVEAFIETDQGQRIRWRGYVNSESNVQRTVAELRAMGWRGSNFNDWRGLGSRKFTFVPMRDEDEADPSKTYTRAAFVKPLLADEHDVEAAKALSAEFSQLLAVGADAADGKKEDDDDIPF